MRIPKIKLQSKKIKSVVIYFRRTAPPRINDYIALPNGGGWIRSEVVNLPFDDALDAANPRPEEAVCNSHPLYDSP